MSHNEQNEDIIHIVCPHCGAGIEVMPYELNCAIFRHGVFIDNFEPIDPHTPKEICEELVKRGLIYGCGGAFRIILDSSGKVFAIKCDYI